MEDSSVLNGIKRMVPPLASSLHKGQAGRVAVIGGSEEYVVTSLALFFRTH